MNMRAILFILALSSLAFSSLVWQTSTNGEVTGKPITLDSKVLVASSDGIMYALDPLKGSISWRAQSGGPISDIVLFDNAAVMARKDGKVFKISHSGEKMWEADLNRSEYNVTYIYGIDANANRLFIATDRGVFLMDKSGTSIQKIYSSSKVLTPPRAGDNYVIFGSGDTLVKLRDTGTVEWAARLDDGVFWKSRPTVSGSSVYAGALDNRMHAYALQGGYPRWDVLTGNWVLSTPLVKDGIVYFGSNDGFVYAVHESSGQVKWKAATQLAVESGIESGFMGGHEVVFAGSTDRNVYAMTTNNGEIVWTGSATDWAGSPLFYQNLIIFGSNDRSVYAFSTERACSITQPKEAEVVGRKELIVAGKTVSEAGTARVYVSINNAAWDEAEQTGGEWQYIINPADDLSSGLNIMSCRVVDAAGEESGAKFTTIGISYDPGIALSDLIVTVSPSRLEGKQFTIYVNDGDDGSPVERFVLDIGGKEYNGSGGNVSLNLAAGTYPFTVDKVGFKQYGSTVEVQSTGMNPFVLGGGILLILIIIWQAWARLIGPTLLARKK